VVCHEAVANRIVFTKRRENMYRILKNTWSKKKKKRRKEAKKEQREKENNKYESKHIHKNDK
jgi:hypothetical protein